MKTGRELVEVLRLAGWTEKRRSQTIVWLVRGERELMLDEDQTLSDDAYTRALRAILMHDDEEPSS